MTKEISNSRNKLLSKNSTRKVEIVESISCNLVLVVHFYII